MRKKYLLFAMALGVLTSCDPIKEDGTFDVVNVSSEEILDGATFEQYALVKNEDGTTTYVPSEDGNYIKYTVNGLSSVTIYYIKPDGKEAVLVSGKASGMFKYVPKRGSESLQTLYFRVINSDGTAVDTSKDFTVAVPAELSPEMRLLVSNAHEKKIWKWDIEWRPNEEGDSGAAWGNMGYAPGDGDSFVNDGNGIWWGATPEELADQLSHSDTGVATGEESADAYMVFDEEGVISTFSGTGMEIRKGGFSVSGYEGGERTTPTIDGSIANWAVGTLETDEGSILFPFSINEGGVMPTAFEILQLDINHLKLVYAKPGTGGWGEATWWAFKCISDADGALTEFGNKDWTWDVDWREDGGCWGNMGYAPGDGDSFQNSGNGIWWGADPETLATPDQIGHSDTGVPTGEEDRNAYMTFSADDATVETFDANGNKIRGGAYEILNWGMGKRTQATVDGSISNWALGTLKTDAGSILFPFKINGGGEKPTEFEIMQLDAEHMKLVYAAPGTGGWGEATWWAFKKK